MGRGAEESEELGNSGDAAGVWLLIARPRGILPRENRGFEEFLSSGFPEMELGILRVMLRAARSSRGKGSRCCGLKVPGARALTAALGQVAIAYSVAENILNCLGTCTQTHIHTHTSELHSGGVVLGVGDSTWAEAAAWLGANEQLLALSRGTMDVKQAVHNLELFDIVGITEDLDTFLAKVAIFNKWAPETLAVGNARVREERHSACGVTASDLAEEVLAELRQVVGHEITLYDAARTLHQAQNSAIPGPELEGAVARLQQARREISRCTERGDTPHDTPLALRSSNNSLALT